MKLWVPLFTQLSLGGVALVLGFPHSHKSDVISSGNIDLSAFSLQDPLKFGSNISPVGVNDARFSLQSDGSIIMSAHQGDSKTANGVGPRCELRETITWNGNSGISNKMTITKSILTSAPITVAQIFNQATNKPMTFIKFDGSRLYAFHNESPKQLFTLDGGLALNSFFTLTLNVSSGCKVQVSYSNSVTGASNSASFTAQSCSSLYFKTGAYSQGDVTSSVHMTALSVSHA